MTGLENALPYVQEAAGNFTYLASEMSRPCVIFKPKMERIGEVFRVSFGENYAVSACGKSPEEAMRNFDAAWWGNETTKSEKDK